MKLQLFVCALAITFYACNKERALPPCIDCEAFEGTITAAGKPIVGMEVKFMLQYFPQDGSSPEPKVLASAKTDNNGFYSIAFSPYNNDYSRYGHYLQIEYDKQKFYPKANIDVKVAPNLNYTNDIQFTYKQMIRLRLTNFGKPDQGESVFVRTYAWFSPNSYISITNQGTDVEMLLDVKGNESDTLVISRSNKRDEKIPINIPAGTTPPLFEISFW